MAASSAIRCSSARDRDRNAIYACSHGCSHQELTSGSQVAAQSGDASSSSREKWTALQDVVAGTHAREDRRQLLQPQHAARWHLNSICAISTICATCIDNEMSNQMCAFVLSLCSSVACLPVSYACCSATVSHGLSARSLNQMSAFISA
jgi:hypothetical protein